MDANNSMIFGRIWRTDKGYTINDGAYAVRPGTAITEEMVEAYLASLTEEERARVLVPEPVPPEPSAQEREAIARNARDVALRDIIDRYNAPRWEAMSESEREAVRVYRQALLDWPESAGFPDLATMPVLAAGGE